jgi:outer membrane usher protein
VVTGQGNVRVVVRDVLGREQIITQPFYASASLLAPGRRDFSVEAGAARRNFAIASNDYGGGFISATHRLGLTESFTGEVRGEFSEGLRAAGLGGVWLVPSLGVVSGALAGGSGKSSGMLGMLGIDRSAGDWNAGMQMQAASAGFTALGVDQNAPAPRLQASMHAGLTLPGNSALGVAGVLSDVRGAQPVRIVSASYSRSLGAFGFFGASLSKTLGALGNTALGLTWSFPLSDRVTAMAGASRQSGQREASMLVQQGLPTDRGFGYLLQQGQAGQRRIGLAAQNGIGTLTLDAAANRNGSGERIGLSGGIAFLEGVHPSRRISDSFAVVNLPDLPDVRVYADNQPMGRTDAAGKILLPRLRPYERNAISIEAMDLPFDARLASLSMEAVPPWRSGLALRFPVTRERGATLTLKLDDGSPMPAGATVSLVGQNASFPVGHGGVVYLTGLSEANRLRASWRGQTCEIALSPAPGRDDPLPDLGEMLCSGVHP